jgi:uncharacterized protein (TIGR02145 family)
MKSTIRILAFFLSILSTHSCNKENDSNKVDDSVIKDADGNIYTSVQIGTQVWTVENLKTTKYNNGEIIGTTSPATLNIGSESSPKYQWAYYGDEKQVATYGRLYTWFAATDNRKVCPKGWHLPSDTEWTTLINYYMTDAAEPGNQLKEAGLNHWVTPNAGASNSSGFTALPGGWRYYGGAGEYIGYFAYWWTSTTETSNEAKYWSMNYLHGGVVSNAMNKRYGLSIRCLKD